MAEFAEDVHAIEREPLAAGAEAHREWLDWSTPGQRDLAMDLGPCVAAMRERLPADTIICNGAGNYSGWWPRYWHYAGPVYQPAPTAGPMGSSEEHTYELQCLMRTSYADSCVKNKKKKI